MGLTDKHLGSLILTAVLLFLGYLFITLILFPVVPALREDSSVLKETLLLCIGTTGLIFLGLLSLYTLYSLYSQRENMRDIQDRKYIHQ